MTTRASSARRRGSVAAGFAAMSAASLVSSSHAAVTLSFGAELIDELASFSHIDSAPKLPYTPLAATHFDDALLSLTKPSLYKKSEPSGATWRIASDPDSVPYLPPNHASTGSYSGRATSTGEASEQSLWSKTARNWYALSGMPSRSLFSSASSRSVSGPL